MGEVLPYRPREIVRFDPSLEYEIHQLSLELFQVFRASIRYRYGDPRMRRFFKARHQELLDKSTALGNGIDAIETHALRIAEFMRTIDPAIISAHNDDRTVAAELTINLRGAVFLITNVSFVAMNENSLMPEVDLNIRAAASS